ncbi:molybdenum cofactor guanylyltransferase MobA [Labrys sp. LIt4]|uniref:molybdenum cofactor guanylyltransferase MobA n=1 Tax=Labrys sp. LIt4 TaxID=2821355 RepID=UPI001ADEF19F|nr:molybdenum cofactor guanylyltransferase MobA [Labrys sp. LIt4]MBP0578457.1 molybdenum cofactor guanylyltransferase MobA [Labrys sp. LIt4]
MQKTESAVMGVILAGGLSRRMGGGDKGLSLLDGRTILERIAARLRPQVAALFLNANGDARRFKALGLSILPDGVPDFPGPLAGVLAGLDHAAQAGFDEVAVVPCDAPFLPADLVTRLRAGTQAGRGAVAVSAGRRHPTAALWPVHLRTALRKALVEEDQRRVETFLRRHDFAEVVWPAEPFDPFANVNDPGGMAEAEALLAHFPAA